MTSVVCGGAADHYCYVEAACLASCSAGKTDGELRNLVVVTVYCTSCLRSVVYCCGVIFRTWRCRSDVLVTHSVRISRSIIHSLTPSLTPSLQ